MNLLKSLVGSPVANEALSKETNDWTTFTEGMAMKAAGNDMLGLMSEATPDKPITPSQIMDISKKYALDAEDMQKLFGMLQQSGALKKQAYENEQMEAKRDFTKKTGLPADDSVIAKTIGANQKEMTDADKDNALLEKAFEDEHGRKPTAAEKIKLREKFAAEKSGASAAAKASATFATDVAKAVAIAVGKQKAEEDDPQSKKRAAFVGNAITKGTMAPDQLRLFMGFGSTKDRRALENWFADNNPDFDFKSAQMLVKYQSSPKYMQVVPRLLAVKARIGKLQGLYSDMNQYEFKTANEVKNWFASQFGGESGKKLAEFQELRNGVIMDAQSAMRNAGATNESIKIALQPLGEAQTPSGMAGALEGVDSAVTSLLEKTKKGPYENAPGSKAMTEKEARAALSAKGITGKSQDDYIEKYKKAGAVK
jgi:hypothetical protein